MSEPDPAQPCSGTLGAQLGHLGVHLQGMALLRWLKYRHRAVIRDVRPLALHLEADVFPLLLEERRETLELRVDSSRGAPRLVGEAAARRFTFPGTEACAAWLESNGIGTVQLDTRLESGQILEALLVLLHVGDHLAAATPLSEPFAGWSPGQMAAAMVSPTGYHKFCAVMRFDAKARRYEVDYSYCDLLFSRLVTTYVERKPQYQDHRVLFRAVPRAVILAWLLLLLPTILLFVNPVLGAIVMVAVGTFVAACIGVGVHALASTQYAREHYNALGQELLRQVTSLSRFPEANPNPTFRLSLTGDITYVNPSAQRLLEDLNLKPDQAPELLPEDYKAQIEHCIGEDPECHEFEVETHGRFLHFRFSPFPDDQSVIAAGADVTYLKRIEGELRELNDDLEQRVQRRTEELRETQDVTILCLAGLAETRDRETGQHLERTRLYVRILAEHLREHPRFREFLDSTAIENVFKCTPLHDIGKVGVRDAILLKPGKLTPEEFEEMKRHTTYGGDALRWASERLGFDSFLRIGQEIAYHHHERWDGTGYPHGKKGDEIPWAARLMALADVYDALVSRRVYKSALTHEMTRGMILDGKGSHFDPDVVEAFLELEDQFARIAREFTDE